MQTNTRNKKYQVLEKWKQPFIMVAFLFSMAFVSKIGFDIGGEVKITLQTLVVCIFFNYVSFKWRFIGIILYLLLGIIGLQMFNGGNGWDYFSKTVPLAFFLGFLAASFISKKENETVFSKFSYFIQVHLIILFLGLMGIAKESGSLNAVSSSALNLLPGAVIKSAVAVGIVYLLDLGLGFYRSNPR